MSKQKEKFPFHIIILGNMERIMNGANEIFEEKIRELGEILRNSILPKKEIKTIVSTLGSFADVFIFKDEENVSNYLRELSQDLFRQLMPVPGSEEKDDFDVKADKLMEFMQDIILEKGKFMEENAELRKSFNETKERISNLEKANQGLLKELGRSE